MVNCLQGDSNIYIGIKNQDGGISKTITLSLKPQEYLNMVHILLVTLVIMLRLHIDIQCELTLNVCKSIRKDDAGDENVNNDHNSVYLVHGAFYMFLCDDHVRVTSKKTYIENKMWTADTEEEEYRDHNDTVRTTNTGEDLKGHLVTKSPAFEDKVQSVHWC